MFNVKALSEDAQKYAKLMEDMLNNDPQSKFLATTAYDVSSKLVIWEMILGREALVEMLKTYLED